MDISKLETAVRRMVASGTEGIRDALVGEGGATGELEWAVATLAGRELLGPLVPTDPDQPWA